jgi:hypothetical protein
MMDGLVSSDDHAASLKNKQSSIFHHSSIVRNKNNPIPGVNLNTANANANANVSSFRRHFIPCGGLTLTNINTSNSGTGFFPTEYDEDDNASEQGDNGDDCLSTASTQVIENTSSNNKDQVVRPTPRYNYKHTYNKGQQVFPWKNN